MDNDYQQQHNSQDQYPEKYDEQVPEAKTTKSFLVPTSKVKLLACERCRLIKTEEQWKSSNICENCRQNIRENDYKKFTSSKFEGIVSIIDTNRSWLRRKLNLGKSIVSGLYAVELL